jgi:hypothetical protein
MDDHAAKQLVRDGYNEISRDFAASHLAPPSIEPT